MSDFSFSDDQELLRLNAQVLSDPEVFEHWDQLVRAAEAQEGGLHRNSSPGAIASTRDVYDKLLARFPLFFGYWKKYADLEFTIGGTEAAEMVYERGVACVGTSVDLWANYCGFKVDTCHDTDVIRELFERGADSVGLDFLAHPFWDKYLEFEERVESHERLFAVLTRIIPIPMHQYARYFERYRTMAVGRPLTEIAPQEVRVRFEQEMSQGEATGQTVKELEQEMRTRIDGWHLEVFHRTQAETTKRWTYESEIKRPYYHLTELDEPQLVNWMKYLDFEEEEGDYARIKFLYERCLVTTANYEDFWLRYARWMFAQPNKQEEVRSILARASCTYVPIVKTDIRLFYAQFEEAAGRPEVAAAIHEAILDKMPNHIDAIISLANLERRQHGVESAIYVLQKYKTENIAGAMTSEWARLVCNVNGDVAGARTIYESNEHHHIDSINFYSSWLNFEIRQAPVELNTPHRNQRVRAVFDAIRKSSLMADEVKDLAMLYFQYLKSCGGTDAMQEYLQLDVEINGSVSVTKKMKEKAREQAKQKTGKQGLKLEGQNGQPIGVVDEDGADHPYFQPH